MILIPERDPDPNFEIRISGDVTVNLCQNPNSNASPARSRQYTVSIELVNTGEVPIVFDELWIAFIPKMGQSMVVSVKEAIEKVAGGKRNVTLSKFFQGDKLPDHSVKEKKSVRVRKTILQPDYVYRTKTGTNGWTNGLLVDSGHWPLQLNLLIRYQDKQITPTFLAVLPRLDELFPLPPEPPQHPPFPAGHDPFPKYPGDPSHQHQPFSQPPPTPSIHDPHQFYQSPPHSQSPQPPFPPTPAFPQHPLFPSGQQQGKTVPLKFTTVEEQK